MGRRMGGSRFGLGGGRLEGELFVPFNEERKNWSLTLGVSVSVELYKEMTSISKEKGIPITMHLAECPADLQYFNSLSPPATVT